MLSVPLVVILHLPPLAFGPPLPRPAFEPPAELSCHVHDLGRPHPLMGPSTEMSLGPALDLGPVGPERPRALLHPALDFLLLMSGLAITHGSWDERSWEARRWEAAGGITPVLIPPLAPPARIRVR